MRKVSNILCILKVPKNYSFLSLKKKLIINSIYFHVIPLKKKEWRSHQLKALILLAKAFILIWDTRHLVGQLKGKPRKE